MKLKKIASLMLAGVMAISMLAGCSNGGNTDNDVTVNTGSLSVDGIVAEMDKDVADKVTFAADANLESALKKALTDLGSNIVNDNTNRAAVLSYVADIAEIEYKGGNAFDFSQLKKEDADAQTLMDVYMIPAIDISEKAANTAFASEIENLLNTVDMPENSGMPSSVDEDYYKYDYTSKVAVAKVENSEGFNGYVLVMTLTCTSAKANVEL